MAETVTERIDGYSPGNPRQPVLVDTYKYHFEIDEESDAFKIAGSICKMDEQTILTSRSRRNRFLIYKPNNIMEKRVWKELKYNEVVKVFFGTYGMDYYISGNGDIYKTLPDEIS